MPTNPLQFVNHISRFGLGFLFIYHGLVPKILNISPIEKQLVDALGIGLSPEIVSPIAGIGEILLGLAIIFLRKNLLPVYGAALALVALLLVSVFLIPSLLSAAFNPVTTNGLGIVLCIVIYQSHKPIPSDSDRNH